MRIVLAGPHAATLLEALGALPGADVVMVASADAAAAALAAEPAARGVWAGPGLPTALAGAGGAAAAESERVVRSDHAALVADPRGGLTALTARLGLTYDAAALGPYEALARDDDQAELAYRSVSTPSFGDRLRAVGATLAITTYQAGRLVLARPEPDGGLNTHFRAFDRPMGIAARPGGLALGLRSEVVDFRTHDDATYLPRHRHVTGDVAVHDMAFGADGLWLVATAFSCLATLDADHSFVPRWTPPWIDRPAPGDACHLNGLAVMEGRPAYVTALGTSTEPGGWRAHKADGGVLVDVASGEVVVAGLSMPHSPRWHDGRLWVLESGRGTLSAIDLDAGRAEPVAELPGFTRGLAFSGPTAFVGLSQIRESSTFGDLPITQRLTERRCGVWTVDLDRGAIDGFLRFDDVVQEVFDVALLPHRRPDVLEPGDDRVATTYALP